MSVSFSQYPTHPIPGKPVRVSFNTDGNYVKVFLTDAPRASQHWAQLDKPDASQVLMHAGDARKPWLFTPDVGGIYQFTAYDISKGATGYGGGWYGSPASYQQQSITETTTGLTITVGTRLEMPIGTGEDTGTLRFYVWDDTCRATNVDTHGETTPAIVNPSSERLENIARLPDVIARLDDLVGRTSGVLTGSSDSADFHLTLDSIIDNFNAHIGSTSYHYTADTANTVPLSYKDADSPELFAQAVSLVLQKLEAHLTNDAGTGIGSTVLGDAYHEDGSNNQKVDHDHRPIIVSASDQASAIAALAEAWRSYRYHRTDTTVHKTTDSTNVADALPSTSVIMVHFYVLSELAKTAPTAATTQNAGAAALVAGLGMTAT
jgi:hypothetical protein